MLKDKVSKEQLRHKLGIKELGTVYSSGDSWDIAGEEPLGGGSVGVTPEFVSDGRHLP